VIYFSHSGTWLAAAPQLQSKPMVGAGALDAPARLLCSALVQAVCGASILALHVSCCTARARRDTCSPRLK